MASCSFSCSVDCSPSASRFAASAREATCCAPSARVSSAVSRARWSANSAWSEWSISSRACTLASSSRTACASSLHWSSSSVERRSDVLTASATAAAFCAYACPISLPASASCSNASRCSCLHITCTCTCMHACARARLTHTCSPELQVTLGAACVREHGRLARRRPSPRGRPGRHATLPLYPVFGVVGGARRERGGEGRRGGYRTALPL